MAFLLALQEALQKLETESRSRALFAAEGETKLRTSLGESESKISRLEADVRVGLSSFCPSDASSDCLAGDAGAAGRCRQQDGGDAVPAGRWPLFLRPHLPQNLDSASEHTSTSARISLS